jgi:hypothetical protein
MSMTPRERLLSAIRGQPVDRVPLDLPGFQFDSEAGIEALEEPWRRDIARRHFPDSTFFVRVPNQINRKLVTPPGRISRRREELADGTVRQITTVNTPGGPLTGISQYSRVSKQWGAIKELVESYEDIEKIRSIPFELEEEVRIPTPDELPPDFAERGILSTHISSPFVCVAGLMQYEWFLELALTEPELIAELTEICRRRTLNVLEVLLAEPGIEYVWLGGSEWVTPPMASPAIYDALVQEQERSLIEYIRSRGDILVHVHCHGNVRHALGRMIERGADYTEPVEPPPDGDITMAEAKQFADGRIALGGNIEARVLYNESPDVVEAATRAAFEGGRQGFVLRTSESPSPRITDREGANYLRMIDVWEELSRA